MRERDGTEAHAEQYRILSDSPAVSGPDPLDFDRQVRQLEGAIVASHEAAPFTVSVEAGWGAGKSTLMRRLRRRLDLSAQAAGREPPIAVKTVWFNAWTAPESQVLEGLIRSVLDELDRNIVRRLARKRFLMRGLGIVTSVGASLLGLGTVVDRVWAKVEDDPKRRNELNDFVRDAMDRWLARRDIGPGGLIVVFIDDLDRCSADAVMEVFEAVKLYLDAPGLVFVLGWDTEQVLRAVAERKGDVDRLAHRYVEKIVQFGYRLPRPTDSQLRELLALYCEQARISRDVLSDEHRTLLIRTANGNPRQMKRFLNRFVLLHQRLAAGGDGANTIEADVLILLLVLQASYDGFYRLLTLSDLDPEHPDQSNPLVEFADYTTARRARDRRDDDALREILARHGDAVDGPIELVFEAFERDRPQAFPRLAEDREFTELVRSMSSDDKRAVWALARSADVQGLEPSESRPIPPRDSVGEDVAPGATVLWVDDHPKREDHELLPSGVELLVASSSDEASRILSKRPGIDLVISDIGRSGRPNAGIEDAATFRESGLYEGPMIFYTQSPTTGQVADAGKLGADVTSIPFELQQMVRRYLPASSGFPRSKMASSRS